MTITLLTGDCREVLQTLEPESVHCVVTSPPYFGLRDYGVAGQIGLEPTPEAFTAELVRVFAEVRRVLRKDGTAWLNLGDSYANANPGSGGKCVLAGAGRAMTDARYHANKRDISGFKPKDLLGIPWRVAFALQADGWYLRQDIIWSKPNPMPESVTDRCTKAHEYLFLLSKRERYYYDVEAIAEPASEENHRDSRGLRPTPPGQSPTNGFLNGRHFVTRNKRSVWEVTTQPFAEAHFATFPPALIEPCIKAGCPLGGTVLDPFGGAGTTGLVADRLQRNAILIELNPTYAAMGERRITDDAPLFVEVAP